jgi:hypothetical protein
MLAKPRALSSSESNSASLHQTQGASICFPHVKRSDPSQRDPMGCGVTVVGSIPTGGSGEQPLTCGNAGQGLFGCGGRAVRWPHCSAQHRRRSPLRRTPRRLSARGRHPVRVPVVLAPLGNAAGRCVATWTCEVSTVRRRSDRCVRSEMLHAARAARTNATAQERQRPVIAATRNASPVTATDRNQDPPTAPSGTEGSCHSCAAMAPRWLSR